MISGTRRGILAATVAFVVVLVAAGLALWRGSGTPDTETTGASSSTIAGDTTTVPPVTTTLAPTSTVPGPVGLEDLVGEYRGKLIREDEPGTPDTFHVVSVTILDEDGVVKGRIVHGPVGANSLDRFGNVVMPLEMTLEDNHLTLHWDESTGPAEDTTFTTCAWKTWEASLTVEDGGQRLVLVDGYVEGRLPDTDVTEWYIGCPAGERPMIRMTLIRQ